MTEGNVLYYGDNLDVLRRARPEAGFYDGKGIDYRHVTGANVTLRRAQRARGAGAEAMELFGPSTGTEQ